LSGNWSSIAAKLFQPFNDAIARCKNILNYHQLFDKGMSDRHYVFSTCKNSGKRSKATGAL